MKNNIIYLRKVIAMALFVAIFAALSSISTADSPPPIPNTFSGAIKFLNSSGQFDVPAGTLMEAYIGNIVRGSTTITTPGRYSIDVGGANVDDGKIITFMVNNLTAQQTSAFNASMPPPRTLDLIINLPEPAKIVYSNQSVNTIANIATEINALEKVNTTLELVTSNNIIGGVINITMSYDVPSGINRTFALTPFGKYLEIDASKNVLDNLTWVKLNFYYTKTELYESGLDESSLRISWYNESNITPQWEMLGEGSPGVYGTGVETADTDGYAGYVWVNISHLSIFALVGSYPTPSGGGGGGGGDGGGGGGGGISAENFSNVELREKYDEAILKDILTSYKFTNKSNPIMFVNITGNVSAGLITSTVEVLKSTSTLIKPLTLPPGIVYKNVNIWVGTSGFAVPKNIKEASVMFRVENSWITSNGLSSNDVKMYRWDGNTWDPLDINEVKKDASYTYYEAKTDAFSPFVISGLTAAVTPSVTPSGITPASTATPEAAGTPIEKAPPVNLVYILGLIVLIAIVLVLYLKRR